MLRLLLFLFVGGLAMAAPDVRRPIFLLILGDGRTLTNVTIVSYAHSAVMAKWDGGRGTIPYELFSQEWQKALEPMRPPPASVSVRPPPPPPAPAAPAGAKDGTGAAGPEGEASAPGAATETGTGETEKALAGLAAEIADLRARLEKIEKRLRQI